MLAAASLFRLRTGMRGWAVVSLLVAMVLSGLPAASAADAATLSGTVSKSTGGALAGAEVEVFRIDDGALVGIGSTGSDGSYAVSGLLDGRYGVRFSASRYVPKWFGGGEDRSSAMPVVVSGGAPATASETLTPGGYIRGTVALDSAASSRKISVFRYLDGAWTEDAGSATYPSATGTFALQVPTAQPVKIRVAWGDGLQVGYWYGDAFSVDDAATVQVDPGANTTGVAITAPRIGYISGKVTNSFGAALSTQSVRAFVHSRDQWLPLSGYSSSSSTNGFKLAVPAGYEVSVRAGATGTPAPGIFGPAWLDGTSALGAEGAAPRTGIVVNAGETRLNQNVLLGGGVGVVGFARDALGRALPNVSVSAWNGGVQWAQSTTDATGWYRLGGLDRNGTNVTVRFEGENLVTEWWKDAADQVAATRLVPFTQSFDGRDIGGISPTMSFVPAYKLAASTLPTITGTPRVGQFLRVVPASWNTAPDAREYRWYCGGELVAFGDGMYVDERLNGCQVTVREEATRAGWESAAATSAPITIDRLRATQAPAVTGAAVAGSLLRTTTGTWSAPPEYLSYQWLRNGSPIQGATSSTYRLGTADVGRRVSARITATDAGSGTEATATSAATGNVRAASTLTTSLRALTRQIRVTFRLETPGATRPGGSVSVYRGTRLLGRVTIGSTPVSRTVTYRVAKGRANFKVAYGGSTSAVPVSKTTSATVR